MFLACNGVLNSYSKKTTSGRKRRRPLSAAWRVSSVLFGPNPVSGA